MILSLGISLALSSSSSINLSIACIRASGEVASVTPAEGRALFFSERLILCPNSAQKRSQYWIFPQCIEIEFLAIMF